MWVITTDFPTTASHPFYARLNQLLAEHHFDDFVEGQCQPFYAETMGRPGLPPGIYFRLLLIGYLEGINSERGIAWRAADSFALRQFLGLVLPDGPPDHSTISRSRRLIDLETHEAVFTWMLQRLTEAGLVKGKTVGIDATTLEANAALRSIVRRDTGESYQDFLTKLAQASGIETPTRADLARLDRKRKNKGSNDDWTHPHDPDAKITKMKDGRTHLAHKAEHVVDLETGAIVGVTVQDADDGDTTTCVETLIEAAEQVETVRPDGTGIEEIVGDEGITAIGRLWTSKRWASAVTSPSPIAADATGRRTRQRVTRCTAIVAAFAVRGACACCDSAVNVWNGRLLIFTRPAACAACISAAMPTFGSGCSFMRVVSISGSSCAD
jgi:transposase